jgi:hypothetical protein
VPVPDINAHILERFGQDLSPEARKHLEDQATAQKNSLSVLGGNALAAAGDVIAGRAPDTGRLDRQRAQIDEDTTGRFDKAKELVLRDMAASDKLEDRERLRTIQGREDAAYGRGEEDRLKAADPNDPRASDAREMINFVRKKLGLTDSRLDGLGIDQLSKHPMYNKAVELWEKEKMANRPVSMGGYLPGDDKAMAQGVRMAQGLEPVESELPLEGRSPKALQQLGTMVGAAHGRQNTEVQRHRLGGKELENVRGTMTVLNNLEGIGKNLPGWDTGLVKNKADLLKWYGGFDDPQKAAIRTQLGLNLADYIKSISGAAVNENERHFLEGLTPGPNDDEDTLFSKMEAFRNYNEDKLNTMLETYGKVGDKNVSGVAPAMESLGIGGAPKAAPAPVAAPAGQTVRFQANGKLYNLPAEKVAAFLAKYPDAKKVE